MGTARDVEDLCPRQFLSAAAGSGCTCLPVDHFAFPKLSVVIAKAAKNRAQGVNLQNMKLACFSEQFPYFLAQLSTGRVL